MTSPQHDILSSGIYNAYENDCVSFSILLVISIDLEEIM